MKKALLTTLGVAALGMVSYAATVMQVKTDDGKIVNYDVDHVTEVVFVENVLHDYVDLGLPSGTLWATYNIGATKPEENGDYFAWGETSPKKVYDWSTYKYAKAVWDEKNEYWTLDSMTKYNSEDGLKVLLSEDDAATANWGVEWCMPTNEELQELVENCEYSWVEVNGVKGAKFTASNGISIFFPATDDGYVDGRYWASLLYEIDKGEAYYLGIGESGAYLRKPNSRYFGYSVRAIRTQKAERKKYSVKFYTSDSILIESQNVVEGMSAKEVKAPEKNGYDFVGWSAATDSVVSNMSVYALYKKTPASAHAYVDLGLPSGTLWATYNIGATKPEEFGDYFAWGETSPKEVYEWSTYKYAKAKWVEKWDLDSLTKYNSGNKYPGVIDSLTTLLAEDDAATANWGSDWRMPTTEEQEELFDNCQREWTEVNGVSGTKFTGANGNSIFLPAAGSREGSDVNPVGTFDLCWSSSLYEENEFIARGLDFSGTVTYLLGYYRFVGVPVRAVRAKKSDNIVLPADTTEIITPVDTTAKDTSVAVLPSDTTNIDTTSSSNSYVDLGLPSGTLWATYNIGATKPEEFGDYFAWGETSPKEVYDWTTYKYAKASGAWELDSLTKYNSGNYGYPGVIDSLTTLLAEDDAATVGWGSDWRMPTTEEHQELIDNCQYEWTEVNGVSGAKFTGFNGNSIFLPAAGRRYGLDVLDVGSYGYYWLSSFGERNEDGARYLSFDESEAYWFSSGFYRLNGFPVRAVRAKK